MTSSMSFTPDWRRPRRRENDIINTADESSSSAPFWWSYPCLVCGKPPPSSSANKTHKRCSRCKAAVYCSAECQKQDYTAGKHKTNCLAIAKLWEEKKRLEDCFWKVKTKTKSTNPFDDEEEIHLEYPTVGKFWHDQPNSEMQNNTVKYVVTLLQLVQLLGRGESWRVSKIQVKQSMRRRCDEGNPLAREHAIDLAFQLIHLDRTDMRVRLLIPSLLLEGCYLQEAYDYLKYWLQAETSMMIMDLALMSDEEVDEEQTIPFLGMNGENMFESPEKWMDGEMIYPSIGMVFELAYLKCTLLCSFRSGQIGIAETCEEEELVRQVTLLFSLVHKWNPNLIPNLAVHNTIRDGASSGKDASVVNEATPPGLDALLNKQPPGFELQYKMGNPGGQTLDEAVAIWQRDMILWHVVDPMAMEYLLNFSSNLQENLVSVESLKGGQDGNSPSCDIEYQDNEENANKRREAEELVKKLKQENPDRTMDQIMMHPDMAQLMIKHLNTEK
ncbi:hypothetical protein ACHAXM_002753 [Skeletonema potamos]